MSAHPSALVLRRMLAGEAVGGEPAAHAATCETCAAKLQGFRDEQRDFERAVPFDRFASEVRRKANPPVRRAISIGVAIAAMFIGAFVTQMVMRPDPTTNRVKGGASVDFVVAGGGGQRQAAGEPEALAGGERVRLGLTAGVWRYAIVVSIDEHGTVTPIYNEDLRRLGSTTWLPDSLEFTGHGLERIVVVLSDSHLSFDTVAQAAQASYKTAHGDLTQMPDLQLPGEQFQRTFLKP